MRHLDPGALAQGQHLSANRARRPAPRQECHDQRHLVNRKALLEKNGGDDQHEQTGDGQANVDDAADDGVDGSPIERRDKSQRRSHTQSNDAGNDPNS